MVDIYIRNLTYENSEYMEDQLANTKLFNEYSEGLLYFAFLCCVFYMLVGIPGNLFTIIALVRCKKIHNATTAFIINLACSDMLFCCFNLPMVSATYWKRSWPFGTTMCRMFPLAGYGLVAVSLLSILAIMVNRYISIAYRRLYPKVYIARYIAVKIIGIWIFSFGMLIPTWFNKWGRFGMDFHIGSCSILPDSNERSPKTLLFVGAFLIPCLLILVCYLRIFCIVRKSTRRCSSASNMRHAQNNRDASKVVSVISSNTSRQHQNLEIDINHVPCSKNNLLDLPPVIIQPNKDEHDKCPVKEKIRSQYGNYIFHRIRQSVKRAGQSKVIQSNSKDRKLLQMIIIIVVCFWVCYLPITVIKLCRGLSVPPVVTVLGYLLVYLTTCINPVIYVVMSNDYRQAYKNVFVFHDRRSTDPKTLSGPKRSQEQIGRDRRSYAVTAV